MGSEHLKHELNHAVQGLVDALRARAKLRRVPDWRLPLAIRRADLLPHPPRHREQRTLDAPALRLEAPDQQRERVGEVIKRWPGRTIRDFDDTWFTLMTMDTNPLHFAEHFASQSQHGRCLVNGTLVFALTVGMSVRDIGENALANLEYEKIVHHAPTFHGDTILR